MERFNDKVVVFLPAASIESALAQIKNISEVPFLYKHVAVMPDCHAGKGAPVGTVIATKGAVIPAAVGVDIGCGMIAVKTSLELGTLGGGNHFIEVCVDETDRIWLTLHSGSRGIGNRIGNHYIKSAGTGPDRTSA